MQKATKTLIESLVGQEKTPKLSLYMPTHRYPSPPHIQEDQTRYKNLIREARDQLVAGGDEELARKLYDKLEPLLDQLEFWQATTEGLALFASSDQLEICHLPMECETKVEVGEAYEITPLLVLLSYDQPFYLLALAVHQPKLFRGDMYGLEEVAIDFPASPEDALNIDEMFSGSNTMRVGNAGGAASPHGQGDSAEAGREERLQYFRILDALIADLPGRESNRSLLLAATDNDAGDYKNLSKLPVLETYVQGNHTATPLQELHALAWPQVRDETGGDRQSALLEKLQELQGTGKASSDMKDMVLAAEEGRIGALLVGMLEMTADSVRDSTEGEVPVLCFPDDGTLLQLARQTFQHGGEVVGLERTAMPGGALAAAVYRY